MYLSIDVPGETAVRHLAAIRVPCEQCDSVQPCTACGLGPRLNACGWFALPESARLRIVATDVNAAILKQT